MVVGIKILVESTFGNNINNSKFVKTAKRIDKEVLRGTRDVEIGQKVGEAMLQDAKSTVHVLTGNLRDRGLQLEKTSNGFIFYVDESVAPYGPIEEFGTPRRPGHPYFYPAVDRNKGKIVQELRKYYRSLSST